jgi:hypothetical protein
MYELTSNDKVVKITNIPKSDPGAPSPIVLASENNLVLVYQGFENIDWEKSYEEAFPNGPQNRLIAVVRFGRVMAHMFGPPNDDTIEGHPLAEKGLEPYSIFRIDDSSWINKLEQMNSVHEFHSKSLFQGYIHYIFTFHDSTFECIAINMKYETKRTSYMEVLQDVLKDDF